MTDWPQAPQNVEAEQHVLGTLLVFYKPQLVHIVQATGVKWNDFTSEGRRVIYRAVLRMHAGGEWVEVGTVARFLTCQRHESGDSYLNVIGGQGTLELLACFANANGVRDYARIVAEDGRWRRWLRAMLAALESIDARDEDAFWAAVATVREDVLPGELRIVESGEKAA